MAQEVKPRGSFTMVSEIGCIARRYLAGKDHAVRRNPNGLVIIQQQDLLVPGGPEFLIFFHPGQNVTTSNGLARITERYDVYPRRVRRNSIAIDEEEVVVVKDQSIKLAEQARLINALRDSIPNSENSSTYPTLLANVAMLQGF